MSWVDPATSPASTITGQDITGSTKGNEHVSHLRARRQYDGLVNKLIERGVAGQREGADGQPVGVAPLFVGARCC